MKAIASGVMLALLMTGCASGPETRIVNATGADPTRYGNDLSECRRFASQFELDKAFAQAGATMGAAMIGGAVGIATGGVMSPDMVNGMRIGMVTGAVASQIARAEAERTNLSPAISQRVEPILVDCMRNRGYPIVDGRQPVAGLNPASYFPTAAMHAGGHAAPVAATQQASAPMPVPAHAAQPAVQPSAAAPGRDKAKADVFARQHACSTPVAPWAAATGPGYETYSTDCRNGARMFIRCELGNCRELK